MKTHNNDQEMAEEYDFSHAKRGAILPPRPNATEVRLRIDNDLLDWCRAQMHAQGGGDYEDLINEALRLYREYAESVQARKKGL